MLLCSMTTWGSVQPDLLDVQVRNFYKYRPDKQAGREILLTYRGDKNLSGSKIEVSSKKGNEITGLQTSRHDSISVLLPPAIGVETNDTIVVSLLVGKERVSREVVVPAMRHWTVYIYPHSHVDIGYTNTQDNVEFIHKRNLDVAMELIEETKDFPEDARFRWNPEVTWPIERYMASESPTKKKRLMDAIKRGDISVDAGYVSTNTSAGGDEELLQLFGYAKKLEKETGRPVQTMVQVDVPGMTWGIVPAANQLGIRYCLSLFNGSDRTGLSPEMSFKPFWWVGPDGKSKVLFLQPGDYTPGAKAKGIPYALAIMGQTDRSQLTPFVKTDNPRDRFIDSYLADMLPRLEKKKDYPFDVFPMTWAMADNTPIDVDLPYAVKSWNEEFAFPHLKICNATEMMQAFEKYGDQLPTLKGDYTEYWTDGLGTGAAKTGESREVKDRLVQAEILWCMLNKGKEEPEDLIQEAWRNIILSTEHTWMFFDPYKEPISSEILKVKFGYFDRAKELTEQVMEMACQAVEDKTSNIITVFNTNTWAQTDLVKLPKDVSEEYASITDESGKEVVTQRLSTGELAFLAEEVPALGNKQFTLHKEKGEKTAFSPALPENVLDNGLVRVQVDPWSGDVVSLKYRGEEYADKQSLSALNSFRYLEGGNTSAKALKDFDIYVAVGERGPLVNSLIVTSKAKGCNGVSREICLTKGSVSVEFNNVVDKQAVLDKEGVHFGFAFNVPQSKVKVNIPWGTMELEKEQLKQGNRNWIAMQRWLDISNEKKGVTWCSLNACAFESGDITANVIGGANGSPKWIRELQPSSVIYSWAMNNHWHTNFPLSQKGKIGYKYRMLPHEGGYDVVRSNRYALEQYRPLVAVQTKNKFKQANTFALADDDIFLSTFKTVSKGRASVIRLYSVADVDKSVSIDWKGKRPKKCYYVINNDERVAVDCTKIEIPAKGVISLRVEW